MIDFDTMLMHVGEFGLYQKILFVFQAPFCIFVTFVSFGQLFILLYPMNYWCDSHFQCITINSIATSAQRRNISFAARNDGFFRTDPCQLNKIDDNFLRDLNTWSDDNCLRDRSTLCPYDHSKVQKWRPGPDRSYERSSTEYELNPPANMAANGEYDEGGEIRRERRYGSYSNWKTTTTEKPEQNYYPESESRQNGNSYYGSGGQGQRGSQNSDGSGSQNYGGSGSQNYGGSGSQNYGGSGSQNYESSGSQNYGGSGSQNYGGSGSRNRPGDNGEYDPYESTTRRPTTNRYPTTRTTTPYPSSTSKRTQDKKRTDVTSAFAGWQQPYCEKQRFSFNLANNTVVLQETLNLRYANGSFGKVESCKIRWNRSEIPYETIVTEGNWWCNAEFYTTFAQGVFFLGAIVGGFLIGWIADTFGRVPALVIANILGAIGGALSAVSTNIWVFSFFRFITGMSFDNCFTMMYILVLEFCGPTYRTLVANLSIAIFYTFGTLLLPLMAVLISDWRIYALTISLPMLLALLALFFVPESARWMVSKGRAKEATNILRNFAKVNRRQVDDGIFVEFEQGAAKLFSQYEHEEEPSLTAAFRYPRLRRTFIFLIIFWAMIALVYDGHSRNVLNLANEDLNVFWMFAIASMTEFPADMLLIFTLDRFGRRWLAFGSMTLSGAFSFIAAAITAEMRTAYLITAIISRFWVNVAFNIGLQYAAELLPTVIRAQGVNTIHIVGYVAQILSPFVAAIGRNNPTLSLILLGAFALTAGFASLFLAETLGEDLPNTLEEAEAFGKNQSFFNCPICAKERDDEAPMQPPPSSMENPVVLRNALRGSIRGETYRSSMISNASSGGPRNSRYVMNPGGSVVRSPQPTEMTSLTQTNRRITH